MSSKRPSLFDREANSCLDNLLDENTSFSLLVKGVMASLGSKTDSLLLDKPEVVPKFLEEVPKVLLMMACRRR